MSREKIIESRMKEMNVTYKDIAKYSMLSEKAVKHWIENKGKIPLRCAFLICDLLNIDFTRILKQMKAK